MSGRIHAEAHYFLARFDLADLFAVFSSGGGGVFASRFTASVKLMFTLRSMAFGMAVKMWLN